MLRARTLAALLFAVLPAVPVAAQEAEKSENAVVSTDASAPPAADQGAAKAEAPAVKPKPLPPTLTASIDLARQTMTVKVGGETRYSWPISSGVAAFATPTGNFRPQWTAKMWYSRKYDMAPMPNAVFINGGVAVHGTSHTKYLGSPASHGCIRLAPSHAATFYNLVQRHGMGRTRVSVHGRPNWKGGTQIASRNEEDRRSRYAENQGSWFWGNSSYDFGYDSGFTRKKAPKGYVYIDGKLMKIYRKKNGEYVYRQAQRRADSGYYSSY